MGSTIILKNQNLSLSSRYHVRVRFLRGGGVCQQLRLPANQDEESASVSQNATRVTARSNHIQNTLLVTDFRLRSGNFGL